MTQIPQIKNKNLRSSAQSADNVDGIALIFQK